MRQPHGFERLSRCALPAALVALFTLAVLIRREYVLDLQSATTQMFGYPEDETSRRVSDGLCLGACMLEEAAVV